MKVLIINCSSTPNARRKKRTFTYHYFQKNLESILDFSKFAGNIRSKNETYKICNSTAFHYLTKYLFIIMF